MGSPVGTKAKGACPQLYLVITVPLWSEVPLFFTTLYNRTLQDTFPSVLLAHMVGVTLLFHEQSQCAMKIDSGKIPD